MKYLYKKVKGEVVSELFEGEDKPAGWVDDPAKCKETKKKAK